MTKPSQLRDQQGDARDSAPAWCTCDWTEEDYNAGDLSVRIDSPDCARHHPPVREDET